MSRSLKRPPQRPTTKRNAKRRAQPSRIDKLVAALPVNEATLHKLTTAAMMTVLIGAAGGAAFFFGVPQAAAVAAAEQIGKAGFRVDGIEVTGTHHVNPMTVYTAALDQQSRAMPLVDVAAVRQRLLGYPWVADAQVSRRLPDKLVINIVERVPAAAWQNHGELRLIDADGRPLQLIKPEEAPDLPLVIGEGANWRTPDYRALLAEAPALKPLVRAATWVGNRRWNLLFQTGETLALPEEEPEKALIKFAELDGSRSLLGKGWVRFDMRDPSRLVARKPGAEMLHAPGSPAPLTAGTGLTTTISTDTGGREG
ncbi:MAG: cell division protein FtsQ/DivIB [Sphingomonas sp.]